MTSPIDVLIPVRFLMRRNEMKKKTGQTSQYKGAKIGKIMRDFDISFSDALSIHIQSKKK